MDEPARHHLSPPAQYSGELGHRGQCPGHGVRQYGRDLRHRRRVYAQSLDRREKALRRVSDQRAGRRRGRRHPHAAGDHRSGAPGGRFRQAVDGDGAARRVRRTQAHPCQARTALSRHAGSRIHSRAGQVVDAANPQRQAHRASRAAHRRRSCAGEIDHQGRGFGADRSRGARSAPASDHRPQSRTQNYRHRIAGFAWRGEWRDRVLFGRSGTPQEPRPQSHFSADRNLARGHPWHARRRRHFDHTRRHDLACGGGRARHGQAVRLRRRLVARRLPDADYDAPAA